jgi:hypothetical protein
LSVAKPQTPGLVDTISAGYFALHRRPWAILIPAALSAYLWLGSPLIFGDSSEAMSRQIGQAVTLFGGSPQAQQELVGQFLSSDVRLGLAWLNLVPVLGPTMLADGRAITLGGPLQLLIVFVLINVLTLLCSSLFLTVLGGAVSGEPFQLKAIFSRSLEVASTIGLAILTVLGVGLLLGLPFLAISVIVITMVPAAALPVVLAWYIACFWAYVYAGFAPEAILISRSGPLRALYNSVNIVRRNLIGTLGLLLLSFLIVSGLGVIWRQLATEPLGMGVAILGSAYVGSGLSAARLEFYRTQMATGAADTGIRQ